MVRKNLADKSVQISLGAYKFCHPPTVANAAFMAAKNTPGTDKTVQRNGVAKAGTRCKQMTRPVLQMFTAFSLTRVKMPPLDPIY